MTARSLSYEAGEDVRWADASRAAEDRSGMRFRSASEAFDWYCRSRTTLDGPKSMHPQTRTALDGTQVVVRVDGGKGGQLEDVLTTLSTLHDAVEALRHDRPAAHMALLLSRRDGVSQSKIAQQLQVSQGKVSAEIGSALNYLTAWCRACGVLTPMAKPLGLGGAQIG